MRECPECGEPAIPEHSVLASRGEATHYSRCFGCDALFVREDIETLTPAAEEPKGQLARVVPPWKGDSVEAHFELSWDATEAYYDFELRSLGHLDPLRALFHELREAGYDRKLRAGQSLHSLGLSRSRDHGLREGQSHLYLTPEADGRVRVEGLLAGQKHRFGPVPCRFTARIQRAIETLTDLPID